MLSYQRKTKNEEKFREYTPTGPYGHSEPIGWRIVDSNSPKPEYEREPANPIPRPQA